MHDKDFDRLFSRKMEQLPDVPHEEHEWSAITARLDRWQERRRRWVPVLLASMFALLLGGNAFWWHQWRTAQGQLSAPALRQTLADTILRQTTIVRFDTIYEYRTVVLRRTQEVRETGLVETLQTPDFQSNEQRKTPVAATGNAPSAVPPAPENALEVAAEQPVAAPADTLKNIAAAANFAPTDTAAAIAQAAPPPSEPMAENAAPISKAPRQKLLSGRQARAGLEFGSSVALAEGHASGRVVGFGLRADAQIWRNFRLIAGVGLSAAHLEARETEGWRNVPVPPPPGSDFRLKHWEARRVAAVSCDLGLRYDVPVRGKRWQPFVSAGLQAAAIAEHDIEFEFIHNQSAAEARESVNVRKNAHLQGASLAFGVERALGEKWQIGAKTTLLVPFSEYSGPLDRQFGLRLSAMRRFR